MLDSDLAKPHVYYELDKFYSNYRAVVTNYGQYTQLRGGEADMSEKDCQGVKTIGDLLEDKSVY